MTATPVNRKRQMLSIAGWRYFGKEEDATGSALAMLLIACGVEEPSHVHCLTGRPALIRAPLQPTRDWLTSVVPPVEGILRGLRLYGFKPQCQVLSGTIEDRCATFLRVLHTSSGRPVLCGPLDRARLWNRFEGRYSAVPTHFVLVLSVNDAGLVMFHDPEGVPFAQRPMRQLFSALQDGGSLVFVEGSALTASPSAILAAALRQTAELREEHAAAPDVSARGLRGLVPVLKSEVQVGSARMALHAGLSFRGRSAVGLAALAADIGTPPTVYRALTEVAAGSALALRCLRGDDSIGTSEAISRIADGEEMLDHALSGTLGCAADRATLPHCCPS